MLKRNPGVGGRRYLAPLRKIRLREADGVPRLLQRHHSEHGVGNGASASRVRSVAVVLETPKPSPAPRYAHLDLRTPYLYWL